MRTTPSSRLVALLAVCALLLSAFVPVAAPCAQDEVPAPMPCHEGMPGMAMHDGMTPSAPEAPAPPRPPRSVMACCTSAVTSVLSVRADVDLSVVATVVLPALARPAQVPARSVAPDASPPRGHPPAFSILYGCFLT